MIKMIKLVVLASVTRGSQREKINTTAVMMMVAMIGVCVLFPTVARKAGARP